MSNLWIIQSLAVIVNNENKLALCVQGKYKKQRQINLPVVRMETGDLSPTAALRSHLSQNFSITDTDGEWLSFKGLDYMRLHNKFMPSRKRSEWNGFECERHDAQTADGTLTSPELLVYNSYYFLKKRQPAQSQAKFDTIAPRSHYGGHVSDMVYMTVDEIDALGEQYEGIDVAHDLRQVAWAISKHMKENK